MNTQFYIHFVLGLVLQVASQLPEDDYCLTYPDALQCIAFTSRSAPPKKEYCNPFAPNPSDRCEMNDLIWDQIAHCVPALPGHSLTSSYEVNAQARCSPRISSLEQAYKARVVDLAEGEISCVPVVYGKKLVCGDRGTRCVCDTVAPAGTNWLKHECRCQWFVDYCEVSGICQHSGVCQSVSTSVSCKSGSFNQCVASPRLCGSLHYCVELDDENYEWQSGFEKPGYGYQCFPKLLFQTMSRLAPFCNFYKTNHTLSGAGFVKPSSVLDYCCYQHLACTDTSTPIGGYLFRSRPCFCNVQFRNCLKKAAMEARFKDTVAGLMTVVNSVRICTMRDGECHPKDPKTCSKGDLIQQRIAHCKVNCKTGPLLPIEIRSCKIRQCRAPNSLPDIRIIDEPFHQESSLCEAVPGLEVTCGFDNTRCVCDGLPPTDKFSDRCRCQYWVDD